MALVGTQEGISAQLFRKQPGYQPPDLTLEDGGLVKAEQLIQEVTAVDEAGEEHGGVAQADVEHQVPDTFVPVSMAEPLEFAAKVFQENQLP